jgi:hypothetical protein
MFNGWIGSVLAGVQTVNQILTAGIAITAFSLFLYALSFNLRDRVAKSFAIILVCVVIVFTTDALQSKDQGSWLIDLLLRVQWVGIVFLPAAYLHLSDALLVTAGRPSRGRRRLAVRLMYVASVIFLLLLGQGLLVGPLIPNGLPAPHLKRTIFTEIFTLFYILTIALACINFIRAYARMLTRSGQRRMFYLMAGATAPALGSYPYLMYGSSLAAQFPFLFWLAALVINLLVGGLIIVMAYAVAFFGVSWPDRLVKSRLFKWIMRGPITASAALGIMTVVRRAGELFGMPYSALVPLVMVAIVLLLEHGITLVSPLWERVLFFGVDRAEIDLMQNIEERLLTRSDLQQFLEAVLAAVRDHLQSPSAFVASLDDGDLSMLVMAGNRSLIDQDSLPHALEAADMENGYYRQEFVWDGFWILPLRPRKGELDRDQIPPLIGILGVARHDDTEMDGDQRDALWLLADRAALALEDRQLQQRVFRSLQDIQPQVEMLQRMRAAGRFDTSSGLLNDPLEINGEMADWVKDALTHYWGGPKLTESPLLRLRTVQVLMREEFDGNAANALRAILRRALDQIKPEGERRFTSEWILYNILEMKFIEGRKVRDVAARLAMSEADLYRKQRVAVEAVAKSILDMEEDVKTPVERRD